MEKLFSQFNIVGTPVSWDRHGEGHINHTYLVTTDAGKKYIFQLVSSVVFKHIPELMDNICQVTEHIFNKTGDPRSTLHVVTTLDGQNYYIDADGNYWRAYDYVDHSKTLQSADTPEVFYQSAVIFGTFQNLLSDFPADHLFETIPDFHNTPVRFKQLYAAMEHNHEGRIGTIKDLLQFYLEREEKAGELQRLLEAGKLPLRVTHNDTKLNNVLFDDETGKPLCVCDLDTVMPGLVAYDFGDALRFGASTGAEDEKDLSKVNFDLGLFKTYVKGVLSVCNNLTDLEIKTIPLAAWTITLENGIRFLADYLNGDVYFGIKRPEHNLDRSLTQAKLVKDMEDKWDEMEKIIQGLR